MHDGPHDLPPDDRDAADRADRRADDADSAARRADIEAAATDALRDRAALTADELAALARAASERSAAAKQRWLDRARRAAAATERAESAESIDTEGDAGGPVAATAQPERVCPKCGGLVHERFGVLVEGRWYHGAHLPGIGA